jgi:hypothetical protein
VSAGCLWELQSVIHNDFHGKCVFFLPPPFLNRHVVPDDITRQMLKDAPDSLAELDPEVAWAEFASAAENCGLIVPEYDKRGPMFRFTEHGTQFVPHQYLRGIVRKCAIGWAAMALMRGDFDISLTWRNRFTPGDAGRTIALDAPGPMKSGRPAQPHAWSEDRNRVQRPFRPREW